MNKILDPENGKGTPPPEAIYLDEDLNPLAVNSDGKSYATEKDGVFYGGEYLEEPPSEIFIQNEKQDPFEKGRERITKIGETISDLKDGFFSSVKNVGSRISRFWKGSKKFAGDSAAAVLSIDDLAAQGYVSANTWIDTKSEQVNSFIENKKEVIKTNVSQKVELAKSIVLYAEGRTIQKLDDVRNGIANRYNNIKGYGENALNAARSEISRIKDERNAKKNALKAAQLKITHDTLASQEQAAQNQVEVLARQRAELAEQISLLVGTKQLA